jgi:hemolysin III
VPDRPQGRGEEIANSLSHGLALVAAIVAGVILLVADSDLGAASIVGAAVFAGTMVLLYLTSTLYHALPAGRGKRLFRKLDHCAIYVFIAGCYTPFALGALSGGWGWTLFGLVWSIAALGIVLKAVDRLSRPWLSTGLYLLMGWLVLIAAVPLVERVPRAGVALLVAGGLAYSAGVVFYVLDSRIRYAHAVWHGFVVAGTGFHYVAILGYAA